MPTLNLTISGLCVFAFDQPIKGKGKDPTTAILLLQRLTQSRQLSNVVNFQHEVLDQHFPLLAFDADARDASSTRVPDFLACPDPAGKMMKGVCLLLGDDLTLLLDGEPMRESALKLNRNPPANPFAPQLANGDKETLWWMATLEDAFPGHGTIDPIYIKNKPGPNQPILARLPLSQGELKTQDLTDYPCTFLEPGASTFNQRIATSFVLQVPFQKTVEIRMERPKSGRTERNNLVFSPAAGKDLQIDIKNMEVNELIGFDSAYGPRATADFEIYGELLPRTVAVQKPFLVQTGPGGPAGVGLSSCPPTGGTGGTP